jgi:hypothetical protein
VRRLRLAAAAALACAFACGELAPSPQQVTRDFWEALQAGDAATARTYASTSSALRVDGLAGGRPIEAVLLGETLQGESSAIVRTSLATAIEAQPIHTTFDTHLVREAGEWRIDVKATERELTTAIFASSMQQIGEALGEGVQEFSDAIEQGAAEVTRALREALEELEQELQ